METLELFAKISLNAHLLGGAQEISRENIDRLCSMRAQYGVTGKHPGYKKYPNGQTESEVFFMLKHIPEILTPELLKCSWKWDTAMKL